MAEWLKAHAWKVCKPKGFEGSNPFLSAKCLIQHYDIYTIIKSKKIDTAALPTITPAKALLSLCINVNNMVCTVYCPPPSVHRKLNNIEL